MSLPGITRPGARMGPMRAIFSTACVLALLLAACPKRQTYTRIVYTAQTPTPSAEPSSSTQDTRAGGSLVIQEPPPEPKPEIPEVAKPVEEEETPKPPPRRRKPAPADNPAPEETPTAETPAPEVPALEPRASASHQAAERQQIESNQQAIEKRIGRLDGLSLTSADRKTLDDARTFLLQSTNALREGELERSRLLARKAELLVAALEQEY